MLSLVKVSEAIAILPSQKKGEGFEVGIHFICLDQLMRKPPHAVEGLALALSPRLLLCMVSASFSLGGNNLLRRAFRVARCIKR